MEFWFTLRLFVFVANVAVVVASLCPKEDGLIVIPICTLSSVTNSDVAISTTGGHDVFSPICSCSVTVYRVGNVQAPTLYYTGPGYPNCGLEFDINGSVFSCSDGFISLDDDKYEITYMKYVFSDQEACLLFLSGGLNIEFKVECQQPSINTTMTPANTTTSSLGVSSCNETTSTTLKSSETTSVNETTSTTISSSSSSPSSSSLLLSSSSSSSSSVLLSSSSSSSPSTSSLSSLSSTIKTTKATTYGDSITTSETISTNPFPSTSLVNSFPTRESTDKTTIIQDSGQTTLWQDLSSNTSLGTLTSSLISSPKTTNVDLNISQSTVTLTKVWTTSTISVGETRNKSSMYHSFSPGSTLTTTTDIISTSTSLVSNKSSLRTTDMSISSNGTTLELSTKLSAASVKNDEQFPYVLVLTICSGTIAVSTFVVVCIIIRRRKRSKRTSIPWSANDAEPSSYIDAYSNDRQIIVDESVYFTGIPVIIDGQNHLDKSNVDNSLTTPRETDIYAVVRKQPSSFLSIPTPRLESFQETEDPIEGSDIEDELLDIMELAKERDKSIAKAGRSVSLSGLNETGVGHFENVMKGGQKQLDRHERSVSFRETIHYHDEVDLVSKKSKDLDRVGEREVIEIGNKQSRGTSFDEPINIPKDKNVLNKSDSLINLTQIRKGYIPPRKAVSFLERKRSIDDDDANNPNDESQTKSTYKNASPRRNQNLSKDRLREMFLKDLRKAFLKRDIERHAF